MRLGAHISAAGGLHLAPARAAELGLKTFQFFSRSPQGGRPPALDEERIAAFRAACERHDFPVCYVHAPYVINLASAEDRIRDNSVEILSEELRRCSELGVTAMMTHLGSAGTGDRAAAVETAAAGLRRILAGHQGQTKFLVEVAAGAGQVLGDSFPEIRKVLDLCGDDRLGVCLDTAHVFASGYDLRRPADVLATIDSFDRDIGLEKLVVIHLNDSMVGLGARRDRHEHIGRGHIGLGGFRSLLADPRLKKVDLILETPNDPAGRSADIAAISEILKTIT